MRIAPYSTLPALHLARIAPRLVVSGRTALELLRVRHLAVRTEHGSLCVRHLAHSALLGLLLAPQAVSRSNHFSLDTCALRWAADRSVTQRLTLYNSLGLLLDCYWCLC
jgi:hypothetical protein